MKTEKLLSTQNLPLKTVIGAAAVFKARGILAMFSDTLFVDDELLCAQQGLQYRKGQQLAKVSKPNGIKLFPNPTNQSITIQIEQEVKELFTIIITNTLGQIIWEGSMQSNTKVLTNELSSLSSGTYTVQVFNISQSICHFEKLIKL